MRNWIRATAIGLATMGLLGPPAGAETLTDALISAYRNSHLLEQNQALLRAADEDVAVAVSALRPVINYVVNWGASRTGRKVSGTARAWTKDFNTSATVSLDFMIYDAGRRRLSIDIAHEAVMATRQALVMVEQEVLLAAVQAYADVRLSEEFVALRQSNVRLITQELRAAEDRFEVGEITRTDVSIAEARLAAARSLLATAEGNLQIAHEDYKAATGAYPGTLAPMPPAPAVSPSLDEARGVAMRTHPLIRRGQHQVTIADRQVALADATMKPTLGLGASVGVTNRNSIDNTLSANLGLSLNQTIYSGGRLTALYRQAIAEKEASRSGLRQTTVQIDQSLGSAWAARDIYVASLRSSEEQIRAAQDAYDGVREEAAVGARTTLDVLDAEQELLDARGDRLQALANQEVATYSILSAMGLLTVRHLNLGIPTYDPDAYHNAVRNAPSSTIRGKKLDRVLERRR